MPSWVRRLRGVAGTALWWGASFAALGLVSAVLRLAGTEGLPVVALSAQIVEAWALWGLRGGVVYGLLFATAERKRTWAELSLVRAAWLGAVAGGLPPAVTGLVHVLQTGVTLGELTPSVGIGVVGGALTAAGALALARRAARLSPTTSDELLQAAPYEETTTLDTSADEVMVRMR